MMMMKTKLLQEFWRILLVKLPVLRRREDLDLKQQTEFFFLLGYQFRYTVCPPSLCRSHKLHVGPNLVLNSANSCCFEASIGLSQETITNSFNCPPELQKPPLTICLRNPTTPAGHTAYVRANPHTYVGPSPWQLKGSRLVWPEVWLSLRPLASG